MIESAALTLAYFLDLAIGDPNWLPHPVRIMGRAITGTENFLRGLNIKNTHSLKLAGIILVLIIVGSTYGVFYVINLVLTPYSSLLTFLILVYLISTTLATRGLIKSAQKVITSLDENRIEDARKNLTGIVGRDTRHLDKKSILKATIESLAENASDGIIAPLFYFSIGGLPLAMTYKAINTLDSMVGYKNEKYKDFGWAAARLDDIANYIPARITGVLIAVSSFFLNLSLVTCHLSLKTMLRDGRNHPSPNSGIPEAAIAGALGVRLGGASTYEGIIVEKPYIGTAMNKDYLTASEDTINIVKTVSLLGVGIAVAILSII